MSLHNINIIDKLLSRSKGTLSGWHFNNVLFGLLYLWCKSDIWWKELIKHTNTYQEAYNEGNREIVEDLKPFYFGSDADWVFNSMDLELVFRGCKLSHINQTLLTMINEMNKLERVEGDIYGEIYDHLVHCFGSSAGKEGGEFFTPFSLTNLMYALNDKSEGSIYDPTCGSGSLLARFRDLKKMRIYGQEINYRSANMARMNLDCLGRYAIIKNGDTLQDDQLKDEKFDLIVANPPYGLKNNRKLDIWKTDDRFKDYPAPTYLDWLFVLHAIHHLKDDGKCFMLCYPGIFRRERAEKDIRKRLIELGHIEAIIDLPEGLFYGTSIAVTLLIVTKQRNEGILFIDAKKHFEKAKKQNFLKEEHIKRIVDLYKNKPNDSVKGEYAYITNEEILKDETVNITPLVRIEPLEEEEEPYDINEVNWNVCLLPFKMLNNVVKMNELIKAFEHDNEQFIKLATDVEEAFKQLKWFYDKYGS